MDQLQSENGHAVVRINWLPALEAGKSGSHFFVKYRKKDTTTWVSTDNVLEEDHVEVRPLEPEQTYEFVVLSVDGEHMTESKVQEVVINSVGMLKS